MRKKPFIRESCKVKFALLVMFSLVAAFLALLTVALPSFAAVAGSATSNITVHLLGFHTASRVAVPLDDGVTVDSSILVSTSYDQAYSVDYTLSFDNEKGTTVPTAYTKRTTMSQTTLGDGKDEWTLNLATLGLGYGTYTLKAKVQGTGQSTDTITFRYLPVHAKYIGKDEKNNPQFNITAGNSAYVTSLKYKVYRSNTSKPVAAVLPFEGSTDPEEDTYEGQVTLPLDGFTGISTNTYSVDFEGVSASTALGYAFTTKFAYTAPDSSETDTPDMNGEGDAAILVAAGAAVAAASKRRNNG